MDQSHNGPHTWWCQTSPVMRICVFFGMGLDLMVWALITDVTPPSNSPNNLWLAVQLTYFIGISCNVAFSNNIHSTDRHCVVCCFKKWKQGRTSSFRLITGHIPIVLVSSTTVNSNSVPNWFNELVCDLNLRLKGKQNAPQYHAFNT